MSERKLLLLHVVSVAAPEAGGVHCHQTDAPPGPPCWGSDGSAVAPMFEPVIGDPVIGAASTKLSLDGGAGPDSIVSRTGPASTGAQPATAIL
jgi:hypothetical protein